jgi:hypothetical protein
VITIADLRAHDAAIWVLTMGGIRMCAFRAIVNAQIGAS